MALFNFRRDGRARARRPRALEAFLEGFSIEVMPRTAEKVESFRDLLPAGTRVYIAHIEGTPIEDMVATAKRAGGRRLHRDAALPGADHQGPATLADWIARYKGEAGVKQALLLGGGVATPGGRFRQLRCR